MIWLQSQNAYNTMNTNCDESWKHKPTTSPTDKPECNRKTSGNLKIHSSDLVSMTTWFSSLPYPMLPVATRAYHIRHAPYFISPLLHRSSSYHHLTEQRYTIFHSILMMMLCIIILSFCQFHFFRDGCKKTKRKSTEFVIVSLLHH